MIVFHGTAECHLDGIRKEGLLLKNYAHVRRRCACLTNDFAVATVFAIRKTPVEEFLKRRISGIVLEFELEGKEGVDFEPVRDRHCMHEEKEIAVYGASALKLLAIWKHTGKDWERTEVD